MFNFFKRKADTEAGDALKAYRAKQQKDAEDRKAEWEIANELLKAQDACYLGTRNKAWYGTYEEYLHNQQQRGYALMANAPHTAQMQAMGMRQNMNPYANSIMGVLGL